MFSKIMCSHVFTFLEIYNKATELLLVLRLYNKTDLEPAVILLDQVVRL